MPLKKPGRKKRIIRTVKQSKMFDKKDMERKKGFLRREKYLKERRIRKGFRERLWKRLAVGEIHKPLPAPIQAGYLHGLARDKNPEIRIHAEKLLRAIELKRLQLFNGFELFSENTARKAMAAEAFVASTPMKAILEALNKELEKNKYEKIGPHYLRMLLTEGEPR